MHVQYSARFFCCAVHRFVINDNWYYWYCTRRCIVITIIVDCARRSSLADDDVVHSRNRVLLRARAVRNRARARVILQFNVIPIRYRNRGVQYNILVVVLCFEFFIISFLNVFHENALPQQADTSYAPDSRIFYRTWHVNPPRRFHATLFRRLHIITTTCAQDIFFWGRF